MSDTLAALLPQINTNQISDPILRRNFQNILVFLNSLTDALLPSGGTILWSSKTPPDGFLLLNGQAVSRSTYSALFAVYGTAYGVGDGSTTFNLPNAGVETRPTNISMYYIVKT